MSHCTRLYVPSLSRVTPQASREAKIALLLGLIENELRLPLVPATDQLMKKLERLIREYDLC